MVTTAMFLLKYVVCEEQDKKTEMNRMVASLFPTLLLLLLGVFVLLTSAGLNSVKLVSYRESRTTLNGPVRCALAQANKTSSSSSLNDCSLDCTRDDTCTGLNVKNTPVIT